MARPLLPRSGSALLVMAALWLGACTEIGQPEDPCPDDSFVNYENFAAPLLLTWCVPCHSSHLQAADRQNATVGVDFDTYEGVLDHLDRIYVRAVEAAGEGGSAMPPAGGLSDSERVLLSEWIECGAPI